MGKIEFKLEGSQSQRERQKKVDGRAGDDRGDANQKMWTKSREGDLVVERERERDLFEQTREFLEYKETLARFFGEERGEGTFKLQY